MPDPTLARELLSRLYETSVEPVLPEWKSQAGENVLVRGTEIGEDVPVLNKVWPGGMHVPGAREMYNEGLRPMSSILGLLSQGAGRGKARAASPVSNIVRTPEGIILKDSSAGLLQKVLARLKSGEPLESIPKDMREKAMGMEDVVYHGTKVNDVPRGMLLKGMNPSKDYTYLKTNHGVDADLGLHVDHNPIVAHNAISAKKIPEGGLAEHGAYASGDRVFPLKARIANPVELPDYGRWNDPLKILQKSNPQVRGEQSPIEKQLYQEANELVARNSGGKGRFSMLPSNIEAMMEEWNDRFPKILKENNHDSIIYKNTNEGHGVGHSTLLLEPSQVRMPWAKFDPRKLMAGDLLAFNKQPLSRDTKETIGDWVQGPRVGTQGLQGELARLLKLKAAREWLDFADEKGGQLMDKMLGYDPNLKPAPARTTDIELK